MFAAVAMLLAACGGSSDSDNDPVAGGASTDGGSSSTGDSAGDSVAPGDGGSDVDLNLDDPELEAIIEAELDEIASADGPDPSSPYAGVRIWNGGAVVYELLPGQLPDNLAPNEDPFEDPGVRFELEGWPAEQNRDTFVQRVVATTNWAWVLQEESTISRSNYETGVADLFVEAVDLAPDNELKSITGDANALYVGTNNSFGEDELLIELDPTTGAERGRVSLGENPSVLLTITSNANYVAVGRDNGEVIVVDRATLTVAFSITDPDRGGAPVLTTDQLMVVVDSGKTSEPNSIDVYSLPAGDMVDSGISVPRGVVRAFGDTVIQTPRQPSPDADPPTAVAGNADLILGALPSDVTAIYDVYFDDGFIVVLGCCSEGGLSNKSRLFVIDEASGTVVLQSTTGSWNSVVAPAP